MRRPFAALLLLSGLAAQGAPAPTTAPPKAERPDLGAPAPVPEGAPPHLQTIDRGDLREHAYWLADDARQGRYTGSQGQQATAKYVADHFQKLGLKPLGDKKGFLQHYPLVRTHLDPSTGVAFGSEKLDRDFAVLPARDDDKVQLSGKFVFCGNGTAVPDGLAGRIPLVLLHGLQSGKGPGADLQAIRRFADIAQKLAGGGATAGVVCLLDDQGAFGNTLNYHALLPDHARLRYGSGRDVLNARVPLLVLSAAQSRKLLAHCGVTFDEHGAPSGAPAQEKATGKLSIVVKQDQKATATNVVAVLEGTTKKAEALVFSAHHDHVGRRLDGDAFNGADDNASGTAGLLEIAAAFAKGGPRPERSVVFLSVSGEELGLWGSHWFSEHPSWPLERIVANINIDMIGRAEAKDGAHQLLITPSHRHPNYSSLARSGAQLGQQFGLVFQSGDTYYERSDHYHFARKGVPVVFFCDGEHPDYHQVSDTADRLDYVRMEAIARLAFWTGWQAANADARPKELGAQDAW